MGPDTEYALISLSKGRFAVVDWVDCGAMSQAKWSFGPDYAFRRVGGKYHGTSVYMHRVIANTPDGVLTDHANRNKLDNRRRNLRYSNKSTNAINTTKNRQGSSRFKGVSWHASKQKWAVYCGSEFCGRFLREEDAALAYNQAAKRIYGEFAVMNEVGNGTS